MAVPTEEVQRRVREREGLVTLGTLPQQQAFEALKRSIPRAADAIRLFERVEEVLGDRVERDYWAFPREQCLIVRDPSHPGWFLPQRLMYLDPDMPPVPEPPPGPFDWPFPPPDEEQTTVVTLAPPGRPARLRIQVGASYYEATYDERGRFEQATVTSGDPVGNGPFRLDPLARPPQAGPLEFLTRDDLDPAGHPVDQLAEWVADLRPEQAQRGRVRVPVATPGGVTGSWTRGLWNLRCSAWEGRIPPTEGWVVIDAFNGSAVAIGPTFEEADQAWRDLVARVQPLPPIERHAEIPDELPPPSEPTSDVDPETGTQTFSSSFRIVFYPPVALSWPEPRPENVPAVVVPIPAAPVVPHELKAVGFTRVVRLFGEHGEPGFGFVREEQHGFTIVGDDAVAAIDATTLDETLDVLDRDQQAEYLQMPMFSERMPWDDPRYPVRITWYQAWDVSSRYPDLRVVSSSWTTEFHVHVWEAPVRHHVVRVRFREGTLVEMHRPRG